MTEPAQKKLKKGDTASSTPKESFTAELHLKSSFKTQVVIPPPSSPEADSEAKETVKGFKCDFHRSHSKRCERKGTFRLSIYVEVTALPRVPKGSVCKVNLSLEGSDVTVPGVAGTEKTSLSTVKELKRGRLAPFVLLQCFWFLSGENKNAIINIEIEEYVDEFKDSKPHTLELVKALYYSRDTTGDIVIVSGSGKEYRVHKCLLVQQSPVLKAMFEVNMKEKDQGVVKMEEFTDTAVESLIRFLYSGYTEAIEEDPAEILHISHMYQVEKLVNSCWDQVLETLSEDTVFDTLLLADRLQAEDRMVEVVDFFNKHHDTLKKTPQYEKFLTENLKLYIEICKM